MGDATFFAIKIHGSKCPTCKGPYDKEAAVDCADDFHQCRDCTWLDNQRVDACAYRRKDIMIVTELP